MDYESVQLALSVLGLFGIGSIAGAYIQNLYDKQKQIGVEIRQVKQKRYNDILVHMRLY